MAEGMSLRDYLVKISAQLDGMEPAIRAIQNVDKATQQATKSAKSHNNAVAQLSKTMLGMTKRLAITLVGYRALGSVLLSAAGKLRNLFKSGIELNDNLEQTAKKLKKTTEQARAHQIALEVMGKTMAEINQNAELKKTYNELVKLGEGLALPDAAKGMTAIKDIKKAISGLRVTLRYGLQWVYYYLQKYLATPFKRLKETILGKNGELGEKIQEWANKIAKVLSYLYLIVESLIQSAKSLWDGVKKAFGYLDGNGKKSLLAIAAVLMLIFNKGLLLKTLLFGLILLMDDFFGWLNGKESAFGTEFWDNIIRILLSVRNTIAMIINTILDAINMLIEKLGGEGFDFRLSMWDVDAVSEAVKSMHNENVAKNQTKKEAETNSDARAAAASAGADGYNAQLAQGAGTSNYENSNMVNSNNNTTNNINVTMNVTAQNAQDVANNGREAVENALRNVSPATA